MVKNFGLNPSNFFFPILPTLQDIYTTIDKRLLKNFYIKFGITEIHTDISIFNEKIEKVKYLQYRDNFQTFQFREEEDYLDGKELCITHLELDDSVIVQRRTYIKLSDAFSKIGGYMQLMNTAFSLITLLINKYQTEIKLLNGIFHFNINEKKMGLKFKSLDHESVNYLSSNKNLIFSSKNRNSIKRSSIKRIEFNNSKSKNQLYLMDNSSNISSVLNASYNFNNTIHVNLSKGTTPKNQNNANNSNKKVNFSKLKSNNYLPKISINYDNKSLKKTATMFKEKLKLNLFEIICNTKNSKKNKDVEVFKLGNSFYRKRMDIVHVFTLLIITEKVLIKNKEKI